MGRHWLKLWILGCLFTAWVGLAQTAPSEPPTDTDTADAADSPQAADGEERAGEAPEDEATPRRGVLSEFQRMLRTNQSHLTEDGAASGVGMGITVAVLAAAYVVIVLVVLAVWRRSRDPKMWRLRTETMQGEGRWSTHIAYAIRRKIDAEITLHMTHVEPAGSRVQLAYLVAGEIKGRLGEGTEAKVRFPGLKPKSFWQSDQQDNVAIEFELIQPRDRKITLHLDMRAEYRIGKKSGVAGLFQEVLTFAPSLVGKSLEVLPEDPVPGFETPSGMSVGGLDDTGGLGYPSAARLGAVGTSTDLDQLRLQQGELEQRLHLMESRFLSETAQGEAAAGETAPSEELERRLRHLESQLESLPTALGVGDLPELRRRLQQVEDQCAAVQQTSFDRPTGADAAGVNAATAAEITSLRQDLRASEERAAKALRENLQVVVKNMKGLRHELTQLNTAVNDMMQRFVNSERRLAEVMQRLPPED